jgi:hypothetical protein
MATSYLGDMRTGTAFLRDYYTEMRSRTACAGCLRKPEKIKEESYSSVFEIHAALIDHLESTRDFVMRRYATRSGEFRKGPPP